MKPVRWNAEKSNALRADKSRGGVGFEDCLVAIDEGKVLDVIDNPTRPNQILLVVEIDSYAYVVPFVETEHEIFLKTMYPSRKHTAHYLKR